MGFLGLIKCNTSGQIDPLENAPPIQIWTNYYKDQLQKPKNLNKKTSGDHDRANSDKIALEALNDTIFLEGENSNCRDFIKLLKKLCNNIFYNHRENNLEN